MLMPLDHKTTKRPTESGSRTNSMQFQKNIKREHRIEPHIVVWEFNLGLQLDAVEILAIAVAFLFCLFYVKNPKHTT
jgi:hypothetical protein